MSSDAEKTIRKFQKELNAGAVSLALLSLLARNSAAMYGYEIARELESRAEDGVLPMNQGALYPVLRSLEKQGLLESETRPSSDGPPRKYYSVTKLGRTVLLQWMATWESTTDFVNSILGEQNASSGNASKTNPRRRGAKIPRGT